MKTIILDTTTAGRHRHPLIAHEKAEIISALLRANTGDSVRIESAGNRHYDCLHRVAVTVRATTAVDAGVKSPGWQIVETLPPDHRAAEIHNSNYAGIAGVMEEIERRLRYEYGVLYLRLMGTKTTKEYEEAKKKALAQSQATVMRLRKEAEAREKREREEISLEE